MGICRSSSRSDDSVRPFIATAEETATSKLVTPARLARSGSTSSLTENVCAPQSSRTRSAFGMARKHGLAPSRRARASSSMLSPGDSHLHGDADRLAVLQQAHVQAGARDAARQRRLELRREVRRLVLVFHLHDELRVVELLHLGRDREPEARPAAADERGQRRQHRRGQSSLSGVRTLPYSFARPRG